MKTPSGDCMLSTTEHTRLAFGAAHGLAPLDLARHHGINLRFARLPVPHVIVRPDVVLVDIDADPHEAALVAVACVLLNALRRPWSRADGRTLAALLRVQCAAPAAPSGPCAVAAIRSDENG